jgi:DNA-binding NtrC family response regulator
MDKSGIKVLVVDDETALADTLAQRLKMRNLEVETAYNGEQAFSKIKMQEPDVILLDLRMPGMHGMEVLKIIRKEYPHIQVIVLTGHGTDKEEHETKELGGFDFLKKPTDVETLAGRIREAYKKKSTKTA